MKSDLPKTAAFIAQNSVAHDGLWVAFAEKLEREIIALAADKTRLDRLDRNALIRDRTLAVMERGGDHDPIRWAGIEWDGREVTVRDAIDSAAKGQP